LQYYKAVVKVQSDGKSENQEMLVYSDSIYYTEEQVNRFFDGTSLEFETISIAKTKITDVISYEGNRKFKVTLEFVNDSGKEFKTDHIVCADDITSAKQKTEEYTAQDTTISLLSDTKIVEIIGGEDE